MTDTETRWTVEQATALNKLLNLLDDVLQYEVHDDGNLERYEKKQRKILDVMFPERVAARNPHKQ